MIGWVWSGNNFLGLRWVELGAKNLGWVGLGFKKVTHAELWGTFNMTNQIVSIVIRQCQLSIV